MKSNINKPKTELSKDRKEKKKKRQLNAAMNLFYCAFLFFSKSQTN